MLKRMAVRLKPTGGLAQILHVGLQIILPVLLFALVRLGDTFTKLAFSLVLLSKWRMFAVRPRFWPANIRANAVDIIVGLSVVLFMTHTSEQWWQLVWAVAYAGWLLYIKPASGTAMTAVQAGIAQIFGLTALYISWVAAPLYGLVLATGMVCYLAARHFFDSFDEAYAKLLAYTWGYFGAALAWLLGHWLLFYGFIAQGTLILSVLGYGLALLYYFDHEDRLSAGIKRQFVFIIVAILLIILTFSDWGDKVV